MAQLAVVGLGDRGGRSAWRLVGCGHRVVGFGARASLAGGIRRRRAASCALRRRALACMPVTIARWRR